MLIKRFALHPMLRGFIDKIWVFENEGPIPNDDLKLVVPSGKIKLIVPFHNVSSKTNGTVQNFKKDCITLVGVTDSPRIINDETDNPAETIGIEFLHEGAYRFFSLNLFEIKNRIYQLTDIAGGSAVLIQEQLSNILSAENKVALLQRYLISQLSTRSSDSIFEYCVEQIKLTKGTISIKELEKETGYSSRWLNIKFLNKIGVSPKVMAEIIRFQEIYRVLSKDLSYSFSQKEFYNYYYDQAHFIRDFKRFTGMPPVKLARAANNFGKTFYND